MYDKLPGEKFMTNWPGGDWIKQSFCHQFHLIDICKQWDKRVTFDRLMDISSMHAKQQLFEMHEQIQSSLSDERSGCQLITRTTVFGAIFGHVVIITFNFPVLPIFPPLSR